MADEQTTQDTPDVEELDFEKTTLHKLYQLGSGGINPKRWDRVRTDIRFEDVVADLSGLSGSNAIRCPFHGRDSRASFWLYRGSNDGWCFGCPPKEQYYDQVRFVSRYLEISRTAALRWLEKKWDLPALADEPVDEEEEVYSINLRFEDLQEPFILKAIKQVQEFKDVELAEDYLHYYFKAIQQLKLSEEAKKLGEADDASDFEVKAAMTLARLLGKEEIDRVFARKEARR